MNEEDQNQPQEAQSGIFQTSQFQTAAAFMLCLMTGTIGTLAGHAEGSPQVSVLAPVLAMGVYLGTVWLRDPLRVGTRNFGDSFYYMGFLFTLIALAITLLTFAQTGLQAGREDSVRQVFTIFGMAIITTVIGLLGRVVIVNMQKSPVEEQKTQLAAAQKGSLLAARSLQEMAKLLREAQGAANTAREVKEDLANQLEEIGSRTQQQANLFATQVGQYTEDVRESAEDVRKLAQEIQQSAEKTLSEHGAAIRNSAKVLSDIADLLTISVTKASQTIDSAAAGIEQARISAHRELAQMQESRSYPLLWKFAVANTVLLTLLTLIISAAILSCG